MGDNRKAEYEMAPSEDPENPAVPEKADEVQEDVHHDDNQWSGLGKEELLRVADTPIWNWTRNILLILFWVAWVLMLIVAIVLVVKAPSCPHLEWQEKSVFYQVFVRSFKDSDGDGYGDLKGLADSLSTLKDIGVDTVYLSSIYKEPKTGSRDFGQDIVDFMDVDPTYGDLEDFDKLIDGIETNGMHIVLEFVPNHSSDQHKWFIESQKSTSNNYSDFYVWADGVNGNPPNDWLNVYDEPAWTKVDSRNQYYYHNLLPSQPDLNYNNDMVKSKMTEAMDFWLNKKVDGFVLTNVDYLLEGPISTTAGNRKRRQSDMSTNRPEDTDAMVPEPEPEGTDIPTAEPDADYDDSDMQQVQYSHNGDGEGGLSEAMANLLTVFYDVIEKNSYLGKFRVLIPQHSGSTASSSMYENDSWRGFPSSTNFAEQLGIPLMGNTINDQTQISDMWKSWMIGNSEISRVSTRAGPNAKALLMLLFTLPGTPMPYYGEELGLVDLTLTFEETKDPVALADESNWAMKSRDPQRGPYPWSSGKNGGFSDNSTWLKVAEDLDTMSFEAQNEDDDSHLAYFKILAEHHKKPSLSAGAFNIIHVSEDIFAFTRSYPEWPRYVVLCNFGSEEMSIPLLESDEEGTIVITASGDKKVDETVTLSSVSIAGNDAYLILF